MRHLLLFVISSVLLGCNPNYKRENTFYSRTTTLKVFNGERCESSTTFEYQEYNSDSNKVYEERYYGGFNEIESRGKLEKVVEYFYDSLGNLQKEKSTSEIFGVAQLGEIIYTYTPEGKAKTEKIKGFPGEKTIYNYFEGRLKSRAVYQYDTALFSLSVQEAGSKIDSVLASLSLFEYEDKKSISMERVFARLKDENKADTAFVGFYLRKLDPEKRVVSEEFYGADIQLERATLFIRDGKNRIIKEIAKEYFESNSKRAKKGKTSQNFLETVYEYFFDENSQLYKMTHRFPDNRTMVYEFTYH